MQIAPFPSLMLHSWPVSHRTSEHKLVVFGVSLVMLEVLVTMEAFGDNGDNAGIGTVGYSYPNTLMSAHVAMFLAAAGKRLCGHRNFAAGES